MDLSIDSTSTRGTDQRWLASYHGRDQNQTGTLDVSLFTAGTHYQAADYVLPAGVGVGKVTATGNYGPWDAAATDGRAVLAGYTDTDQLLRRASGTVSTLVGFALRVHGAIRRPFLPIISQRTAITETTVSTGQFTYAD